MRKQKLFLWLQAALCVLLCAFLSAGVIRIYTEGMQLRAAGDLNTWIYTREKAAGLLTALWPLMALSLLVSVLAWRLRAGDREQNHRVRDIESERDRICGQAGAFSETIGKERAFQKKMKAGGTAAAALCMLPVLLYLLSPGHFQNLEVEQEIGNAVRHTIPWTVAAFLILLGAETGREKSMEREIREAKRMPEAGRDSGLRPEPGNQSASQSRAKWLQAALMLAALALILHGIFNGSMQDVLIKAVHICTECIGLG